MGKIKGTGLWGSEQTSYVASVEIDAQGGGWIYQGSAVLAVLGVVFAKFRAESPWGHQSLLEMFLPSTT